ncbi:MAG TPA: ATP-binding protein [Gemmatimonadales bacterium]|nr:ATP-binding protein [Gemmatimonadales bacterium]
MRTPPSRHALGAVALIVAYVAAALIHGETSALRYAVYWLPTGVAVAGAWLLGWRAALYVAFATLGHRLWLGRPPAIATLQSIGNGLETIAAWQLLRRLRFDPTFRRFRDALTMALTAVAAPAVGAIVAAIAFLFAGHPPDVVRSEFWTWWRMNTLGILVLAPTLLSWASSGLPRVSRWTLLEAAVGGVVLVIFARLILVRADPGVGLLLTYLAVAMGIYAALRFGARGASLVATILALVAVGGTVGSRGPFLIAGLEMRELALQAFLLIITTGPLFLAASLGERVEAVARSERSDLALRAFQEILPDFTYRISRDGVYLGAMVPPDATPAFPVEQVIGRRFEDLVPDQAPAMRARLQAALAGQPPEPLEYEIRRDGRRRVREARFVRVTDEEALCLVRDITQRKRAEELLAWQARVLELLATGHPAPAVLERIVLGIESQIDGCAASLLLLEGKRLHVAFAPSLPVSYNAAIEGVEIGPQTGSCGTAAYDNRTVVVSDIATDPLWADYRSAALPHGLRACWSVPLHSAKGQVLGTFAVYHREVRSPTASELTLVERAASLAAIAVERERREDLLASINRNLSEGLFRSTPDRGLIYVNQAFATMFGYASPEEMMQVPPATLYADPARREELKRMLAMQGAFRNEEVLLRRRDGSTFTGLVSGAVVGGANQAHQYYDGAVWDITDRKLLEEQLRQAQKMEAVGKLAGGVAHDFNNLLTAIAGYADALLATLPEGDVARQDAVEITRAAERAASLTRQLLAFSRLQILSPRVLELGQVVEQLSGMLRRLIGEDIRLITRHIGPAAHVRVDRGQIEQVLLNLVLNARDAMPQGGTLTITTGAQPLDDATARSHGLSAGPHVCLQVQDTGTGMDEPTRLRAFDPFFTTKEPGKGTGLGLATVYGIVRQSGGSVQLESSPGAGTLVRVYLPMVEEAPEAEAPAVAGPGPSVQGVTTLVVEDEQLVRDLVCRTLRRAGYTVLVASNGEEALALSRATPDPIDLVVTDVVMPRMNGSELAQRLAAERPGIRVLFVSGYANEVLDVRGGLEPGTEYLQKPFVPSVLLDRVRELLTPARARA